MLVPFLTALTLSAGWQSLTTSVTSFVYRYCNHLNKKRPCIKHSLVLMSSTVPHQKRGARGLVWTSWQGHALARYHYCDITSYTCTGHHPDRQGILCKDYRAIVGIEPTHTSAPGLLLSPVSYTATYSQILFRLLCASTAFFICSYSTALAI